MHEETDFLQGHSALSPPEKLLASLREAIEQGQLKPGQRLPSIRRTVAERGVSFHTVVNAYERLQACGLIDAQAGRGYFVQPQAAPVAPAAPGWIRTSDPHQLKAFWRLFHGNDHCMKLGCGWLPPSWRDTASLARVVRRTANCAHSSLVEYGDPAGHLPLRQALAARLAQQLKAPLAAEQLLTTLGATQALDLLIRHCVAPGDRVLVDDPCNSNLVQLLRLRGAQVIGIARRADGPDLEQLGSVLRARPARAMFVNSRLHNPTGTSVSPQNAFGLLQLAHQHDLLIVEDDVYGDFSVDLSSPLLSLDGLRRVVYVGSFSKSLSANLRVGYIAAPAGLIAELADLKLMTCVSVPGLCERVLGAILADGTYDRHLGRLRRRLQTAQAHAQAAFVQWGWELFFPAHEGLFLWVRHPRWLPGDSQVNAAFAQNILLAPGVLFSCQDQPSPWMRINVAHLEVAKAAQVFAF
ncbi:PLP-dependent aminotransferase family protein [Pseudomonas typographi]|uniref:PLP-dependent aminotransferase family protein n=1 Tax=Pseudomonas typographi TaxID=2715964 RepID=A0ABR7Z2B0_9PSED|nr:PLP-dependent aminotransferase family protein [Pseudomonas typographi]MBD1587288.1 PLP-dependent aminotransferase family protein [Pseudomonas typographi]MBD1599605.1 PLP-dependent aminotransferase family protein [Pseudomonas typographi]